MSGSNLAELAALLTKLTDAVRAAKPLPMSASVLMNRAEILDLLEHAKTLLPEEATAGDIAAPGVAETLAQARAQADEIRAQARSEAIALASQYDDVQRAKHYAAELEAAGKARADELVRGAQEYCDQALSQLEDSLTKVLKQVNGGRQVLAQQLDENAPTERTT